MLNEQNFRLAQKRLKELEKEKSEAIGAVKQIKENLKKEFNCPSLASAKRKLEKYRKELVSLEKKFQKDFNKFEKEYKKFLKAMESHDTSSDGTVDVPQKTIRQRKEKY